MRLCDGHWKKLKAEIERLGMGSGVSEHGRHLAAKLKSDKETKETVDPLMGACMMIYGQSIEVFGLGIMQGEGKCPICYGEANPHCPQCVGKVEKWIEFAARDMKAKWETLPNA